MTLLKREMYIHMHGSTHVCTQAHILGRSSHSSMFPWTYPPGKQHTSGSCSSVLQSTPSSEDSFTCYLIMHPSRLLPSVVWWLRGKFILLYTLVVVWFSAQLPPTSPQHSPTARIFTLTLFFNILTILHRPQACSNPSSNCQDWLDLLLRRSLRWLSMSLHMVSGPPLPSSS